MNIAVLSQNAFTTSPHCAPARSSTLTGRYTSCSYHAHTKRNACRDDGLCNVGVVTAKLQNIDLYQNMPTSFQDNSYHTCNCLVLTKNYFFFGTSFASQKLDISNLFFKK